MLKILYGKKEEKLIDVTELALENFVTNNILLIPGNDCLRASIFGDPIPGTPKDIILLQNDQEQLYSVSKNLELELPKKWWLNTKIAPIHKLKVFHQTYKFKGGRLEDEYPEQLMATCFIHPNAKVLEIGSNIGRNTLTIAALLYDDSNLVTIECDPASVKILQKNRDNNSLSFKIEDAALSARPLIQKEWITIPSDIVLPGFFQVKTITYPDLMAKYNISFDTLVLDCEGAFYHILKDFPQILLNVKLIIIENDFRLLEEKKAVDDTLIQNGFKIAYSRALEIPKEWPDKPPCTDYFFQVWTKN